MFEYAPCTNKVIPLMLLNILHHTSFAAISSRASPLRDATSSVCLAAAATQLDELPMIMMVFSGYSYSFALAVDDPVLRTKQVVELY